MDGHNGAGLLEGIGAVFDEMFAWGLRGTNPVEVIHRTAHHGITRDALRERNCDIYQIHPDGTLQQLVDIRIFPLCEAAIVARLAGEPVKFQEGGRDGPVTIVPNPNHGNTVQFSRFEWPYKSEVWHEIDEFGFASEAGEREGIWKYVLRSLFANRQVVARGCVLRVSYALSP
ncbi:hypothetical protein BJ508DRAFT_374138 [Ascobolus immersus RN42]|uniref:Uncharacterized protein n=1 Tax=Ascobolus immersus RN42 TaxID=1160509 RepID=A0A3N4IFB4_ASCIM|nr:hypothetical protein BJ508DRAFT_374138 [Ascobolus immersus RN42]